MVCLQDIKPNPICPYCGEDRTGDAFHYCKQMQRATERWAKKVCRDIDEAHKRATHGKLRVD